MTSYLSLIHGLNETTFQNSIVGHLAKSIEYIIFFCEKEKHPTVVLIRNSLNFISDAINFYKRSIIQSVNIAKYEEMINSLRKFINIEENFEAVNYASYILNSYKQIC